MKKQPKLIAIIVLSLLLAIICQSGLAQTADEALAKANVEPSQLVVFKEKMYLTQLYDIYFNYDQYKDKYIDVEGMFELMGNLSGTSDMYPMLYRKTPGCCGDDGWEGFVIKYEGYEPKPNDWIRTIGKLTKDENGRIYLDLIYLEIKQERGLEFVSQ